MSTRIERTTRCIILLGFVFLGWGCRDKTSEPSNDPPVINSLTANPQNIDWGGTSQLIVNASDPEGEPLNYAWTCLGGTFPTPTDNDTVTWQAPMSTADCDITVEVDDGENISRRFITLHVFPHPVMDVDEDTLDFGMVTTSLTFNVLNTGTGTLTWKIDTSSLPDWLAVNPDEDSTTTQTQVTVTVDRGSMAWGTNTARIRIIPTNEILTKTLAADFGEMTVVVIVPHLPPILDVTPTSLDFGTTATILNFTIQNIGGGTLTWSITNDAEWVAVFPISGSTTTEMDQITVSINRTRLPQDTYTAQITVTSNGGNAIVEVRAVDPPVLSVSATYLDIGTTATSATFGITNTGGGTLNWSISDDAEWVTVNPTNGTTTTETDQITVYIARTAITPGSYTAQITVRSNGGDATVDIRLMVVGEGGAG